MATNTDIDEVEVLMTDVVRLESGQYARYAHATVDGEEYHGTFIADYKLELWTGTVDARFRIMLKRMVSQ